MTPGEIQLFESYRPLMFSISRADLADSIVKHQHDPGVSRAMVEVGY